MMADTTQSVWFAAKVSRGCNSRKSTVFVHDTLPTGATAPMQATSTTKCANLAERLGNKALKHSHKPPPAKFGRRVSRQALTTLSGILAEMGRVYRQARANKLDHEQARSLIWMLGQMRAAAETVELERLHGRLDEMDTTLTVEAPNGYIARQISPARIEGRRT